MRTNFVALLSKLVGTAVAAGALLCAGEAKALIVGYVVQGDSLYKVDDTPYTRTPLSSNWTGASSMALAGTAQFGQVLNVIHNNTVYRVSMIDGSRTQLNTGRSWEGGTSMAFGGGVGKLFVVDSGRLYRFEDSTNPNGAVNQLGGADWYSTTAMTSFNGSLYIIRGSSLRKVNGTTGAYTTLGNSVWLDSTGITGEFWGNDGFLYVLQDDDLWQVNTVSGARTIFGTQNAWETSTTIFCHGQGGTAELHIIQDINDKLLRVDAIGGWHETGLNSWNGPTISTGTSCLL